MADFQLLVGFIAEPYLSSHISCFLGREELKSVVKTDNLHYLWYRRFIIQLRNQELQARNPASWVSASGHWWLSSHLFLVGWHSTQLTCIRLNWVVQTQQPFCPSLWQLLPYWQLVFSLVGGKTDLHLLPLQSLGGAESYCTSDSGNAGQLWDKS